MIHVPDSLHEEAPLQAEGSQEQVDSHAAEPILLEERHQEAKADEDHDVDVLKHWRIPSIQNPLIFLLCVTPINICFLS